LKSLCFFLILSFILPLQVLSAERSKKSRLLMVGYADFLKLTKEQKRRYIYEVRQFMGQQEKKWLERSPKIARKEGIRLKDLMIEFRPFTQAEAGINASGGTQNLTACEFPDKETYPPDIQARLNDGYDRCVLGGYMICVKPEKVGQSFRLACRITSEYEEISKEAGCVGGKVSCASPLFLSKEGKPFCVERGGPITVKCRDPKISLSADEVVEKLSSDPVYEESFDRLQGALQNYCGAKVQDCAELNNRLKIIGYALAKAEH
jgi:hypothetical protein